jgi:hypothetical protein
MYKNLKYKNKYINLPNQYGSGKEKKSTLFIITTGLGYLTISDIDKTEQDLYYLIWLIILPTILRQLDKFTEIQLYHFDKFNPSDKFNSIDKFKERIKTLLENEKELNKKITNNNFIPEFFSDDNYKYIQLIQSCYCNSQIFIFDCAHIYKYINQNELEIDTNHNYDEGKQLTITNVKSLYFGYIGNRLKQNQTLSLTESQQLLLDNLLKTEVDEYGNIIIITYIDKLLQLGCKIDSGYPHNFLYDYINKELFKKIKDIYNVDIKIFDDNKFNILEYAYSILYEHKNFDDFNSEILKRALGIFLK